MATTQIDLHRQGKAGTLTDAEVASGAAIALSKLAEAVLQADGGQALTGDLPAGGHAITGLADPTNNQDAATKAWVLANAATPTTAATVRAASTGNLTLSGTQTVDGVSLSAGDRVLVKAQTAPAENGIYVVAAGAWARAADMDAWTEVPGKIISVEEGTANADTLWLSTGNLGGTLDTTSITFIQLPGPSDIVAGSGLSRTGQTLDVNVDGSTLEISSDTLRVKDAGITAAKLAQTYIQVSKYIARETPSGSVNGSNTSFTLANTPVAGSEMVFLNGILQEPGAGNDYTISGATITYLAAPATGDRLRVTYLAS